MKILDGLKILDLTTIVSGPYATSLLADLGAEVIKIEPPGVGDAARVFESTEPKYTLKSMSPHLLTVARNKRGMVINLRHPRGKEAFYDLVRWADVVVDNYRPGVTERLGIDYPSLKAVNERIVACSITGYGLAGPGRDRAALDACIQAYSGAMSVTGEPAGGPMRAGPLYADLSAGMAGALGILAAVNARDRTGVGQHVDISMLDVQISMLSYIVTMHLMSGLPAGRYGNEHEMHVPYNAYRASDGYLFVAVVINAHWPSFVDTLTKAGLPDSVSAELAYLSEERLQSHMTRLEERDRINESLGNVLRLRHRDLWLGELAAAGVPAAPVNTVADAVDDPHVLARGMVVDVPHPAGGAYKAPGNPIKLSEADPDSFSAPPRLGEDTIAVLRDVLGYDQQAIDDLVTVGAVERLER